MRLTATALLACALTAAPAAASNSFDFDRASAITKLRAAIDKHGHILPVSNDNFQCGAATALRYCRQQITPKVMLRITEAPKGEKPADYERFFAGQSSAVYEINATLDGDDDAEQAAVFARLCTAMIAAFRPERNLSPAARFEQTYRRAANNTVRFAAGDEMVKGGPATLMIRVLPTTGAQCVISPAERR